MLSDIMGRLPRDGQTIVALPVIALLLVAALAGCLNAAETGNDLGDQAAVATTAPASPIPVEFTLGNASAVQGDKGARLSAQVGPTGDMRYNGTTVDRYWVGFRLVRIDGSGTARIAGDAARTMTIASGSTGTFDARMKANGSGVWRVVSFAQVPPPEPYARATAPPEGVSVVATELYLESDGSTANVSRTLPGPPGREFDLSSYGVEIVRVGDDPVTVDDTFRVQATVDASHPAERWVAKAGWTPGLELVDGERGQLADLPPGTTTFEWTFRANQTGREQVTVANVWPCPNRCLGLWGTVQVEIGP